jgi:hypothetical protein
MGASVAAGRLIKEYSKGGGRFYSPPKPPPTDHSDRVFPLLMFALATFLILPAWWLVPHAETKGYAVIEGVPMGNARIIFTSQDGTAHKVATDKDGNFVIRVPKGRYFASTDEARQGTTIDVVPGRKFRMPFQSKSDPSGRYSRKAPN